MVAEVGLEPHDLRVMSPTSYQLLYSAIYSVPQCVIILYTLFQKLQAFLHKKFGFAEKISRRVPGGRFILLFLIYSAFSCSGAFFFLKITSLLKK